LHGLKFDIGRYDFVLDLAINVALDVPVADVEAKQKNAQALDGQKLCEEFEVYVTQVVWIILVLGFFGVDALEWLLLFVIYDFLFEE
jgi:hypothetical protein